MTCREKIALERPDCIDSECLGGVEDCPNSYGYMEKPQYCDLGSTPELCAKCWDREIPGTEEKEKKMTIYEKVCEMNGDENLAIHLCPSDFGFKDLEGMTCDCTKCTDCWNRPAEENELKEPHILDSGNRREFESGAVRDIQEGKGRMDLLPWAAIMEVSKHCENGAKKYGEHNIDKGIPTHSLCDSAARHLAKYLDGWTDEPHLLAAAWNLLWAIQMEVKHPELCDIPFDKKKE